MKKYFRTVSDKAEFWIVVLVAFGYFMLVSLSVAFVPPAPSLQPVGGIQAMLVLELTILIVLGAFLYARGWTLGALGLVPRLTDPLVGAGLALAGRFVYAFVWIAASGIVPALEGYGYSPGVPEGALAILGLIVLNSIFEEVFVCGYVITSLRKTRSLSFAVNASVGIRLVYHLYQGPAGVVSTISMGLIFAYWFARTGRLWPLIIGHGLINLLVVTVLAGGSG